MAVDLKSLKTHPGRNPSYFSELATRQGVMAYNRNRLTIVPLDVPPQPNKYVPHIGAKQRAKGAK